jgi:hypothetical protein
MKHSTHTHTHPHPQIDTPIDRLALALFLAISAPTQEKSDQALALADEFGQDLAPSAIREAKKKAKLLYIHSLASA